MCIWNGRQTVCVCVCPAISIWPGPIDWMLLIKFWFIIPKRKTKCSHKFGQCSHYNPVIQRGAIKHRISRACLYIYIGVTFDSCTQKLHMPKKHPMFSSSHAFSCLFLYAITLPHSIALSFFSFTLSLHLPFSFFFIAWHTYDRLIQCCLLTKI